jgi:putative spermidine/putrescine transport system ATP-binding protein
MAVAVSFQNVSRHYGKVRAVDDVNLKIEEGEFFAMLGPSGSGKTTCLRLIGGFEQPSSGHIEIFGEAAEGLPPYKRNVNTVFQDYALFPHMSIGENVAYGPMIRGIPRADRDAMARESLQMVKLGGYESRKPSQLSGGQRQRVALARALVNQPKVLLLDEPLGALDLKLREEMQEELRDLQRQIGITFVFVTHDQGEALSMADRVAIFNEGRIVQEGRPSEVYEKPRTRFAARFVGSSNVLDSDFCSTHGGPRNWCSLRPEKIGVSSGWMPLPTGLCGTKGEITSVNYQGAVTRVTAQSGAIRLTASVPPGGHALKVGDTVNLFWKRESLQPMEDE